MKTIWQPLAISEREKIFVYINKEYGRKSVYKFNTKLRKVLDLMAQNPQIAPIEPLLEGKTIEYRSMAVGDGINRIVYHIDGDFIKIVDIWDMRKSPEKLQDRI